MVDNTVSSVCTRCFSGAPHPQTRSFTDGNAALAAYGSLHAAGKAPMMCRRENGRFRVCHQPQLPITALAAWRLARAA